MTLQVATVTRLIKHAVGGREPSQDVGGPVDIMNRSGTVLFDMHTWDFTIRIGTMDAVANTEFMLFPADFEEIESIQATDTLTNSIRMTSLEDLLWRRTYTLDQSNFNFYGVVTYQDNSGAEGGPPVAVLQVHPTPQNNETALFTIAYRRRWPKLSEANDNIPVPEWCEELYIQVCREFAKGYEGDRLNGGAPSLSDRITNLKASFLFEDAMLKDSKVQTDFGPIINGHVDTGLIYRDLGLHQIVSDPT